MFTDPSTARFLTCRLPVGAGERNPEPVRRTAIRSATLDRQAASSAGSSIDMISLAPAPLLGILSDLASKGRLHTTGDSIAFLS